MDLSGDLRYTAPARPRSDIMGPFSFLPMECRHSVFSMRHGVSGTLRLNGRLLDFEGGTGYIEGDRGRSFPKRYLWTQCSFPEGALMLSVADIPFAGARFTGIIGFVYMNGGKYASPPTSAPGPCGCKAAWQSSGRGLIRSRPSFLTGKMRICARPRRRNDPAHPREPLLPRALPLLPGRDHAARLRQRPASFENEYE
jgi:hypothetical protein